MKAFFPLIGRELCLAMRHGADTVAALLFFVVVAVLFPLAIGPEPGALGRMAPGIIWVGALLAALLPLERLFGADYEDGSLDLLLLSGLPPALIGLAKAISHWLTTGLPLIVIAAPIAVMLHLPSASMLPLLVGLLPGTLTLSLLGTAGSAIILGARRGAVLLPILVLPLATPVVIFGASGADPGSLPAAKLQSLLLESAFFVFCLPLCPIAAGAGLRAAGE